MLNYTQIKYEYKESVALITLNRPDIANALIIPLIEELKLCLDNIRDDKSVRSVIITGVGNSFSSGGDLRQLKECIDKKKIKNFMKKTLKKIYGIAFIIRKLPKPVIAAVNGYAIGAGMNLALSCDLIIASDNASFGEAFINLGLIPGMGGTFFLPRLVGPIKAAELFYTGKRISAKEANEIGLLNDLVAPEELYSTVWDYAIKLANKPTRAIARTKELLNKTYNNPLKEHLKIERKTQVISSGDNDFIEGVNSFWDKRDPRFKGK